MKLINFICECGNEKEEIYSTEELKLLESEVLICEKCGKQMHQFNFKNNNQVWKFTI